MFWWGGYWSEVVNQVVFIIYITCAHTYAWWCTHVCSGRVKGWCCSRLMGFCCGWVQGHWGSSHQIPTDAGCSSGHALQIHTKSCLWTTNLSLTHTKHRQKDSDRKKDDHLGIKKSHWGKRFFLEDPPYSIRRMFCTLIPSFLSVSYIFSQDWIKLRAMEKPAFLKTKQTSLSTSAKIKTLGFAVKVCG